jgi:hypothetical protein
MFDLKNRRRLAGCQIDNGIVLIVIIFRDCPGNIISNILAPDIISEGVYSPENTAHFLTCPIKNEC